MIAGITRKSFLNECLLPQRQICGDKGFGRMVLYFAAETSNI